MSKIATCNFNVFSFTFIGFLLLYFNITLHAQYENVWTFGTQAGLDFSNGQPIPIRTSINGFGEANASICDKQGQLLFYTEGTIVWDKSGKRMPNGSILPEIGTGNNSPTSSTSQGALIMPMPGSSVKYYVFSLTSFEQFPSGYLYYSIVDMSLNNGFGDIIPSEKGILLDSNLSEQMTSFVGGRCNTWLLLRSKSGNTFKAYSIAESGINLSAQESHVGTLYGAYTGEIIVSPDGKSLVVSNAAVLFALSGDVELFDFDIATGTVSNARLLDKVSAYYGAAFSPDNSKLYVNTTTNVYQFDLTAAVPADTKTLIGTSSFSHLKLAPDGKIYFRSASPGFLSAINLPNLGGAACQFVANAVALLPGTAAGPGLPNVVSVVVPDTAAPVLTSIQAPCWLSLSEGYILQANAAGWDHQWNTGASGSSLAAKSSGTYWVNYHTTPCISHTDTFWVTFPNGVLPNINIQNSCKGDHNGKARASTYTGDTVTYHYTWTTAQNDTLSLIETLANVPSGNYILHLSTANCDTALPFFIPEEEHKVSFVRDSIICQGQELQFKNTSDGYFKTFFWHFGDGNSAQLRDPVHNYAAAGHYKTALIGIGAICNDTSFQTVIVDPQFSTSFRHYPDSICVGASVSFSHQMDPSTISNLNWSFGDGTATNTMDDELQHAYDKAGPLFITLNTQFRACPNTTYSDTIYVYPLPHIDLGVDTVLCLNESPIILKNRQSPTAAVYRHLWSTGNSTANLKVEQPGTYSLTVINEPLGCSATESIAITRDCYLDIPNAFTPNGDGINDYFFPRQLLSKNGTQFKMQIINRWGLVVFETTNRNGRGWDGRFNNKEQPSGVYVYVIHATIDGMYQEDYRGKVTLLR